jgi:hypothetical protein
MGMTLPLKSIASIVFLMAVSLLAGGCQFAQTVSTQKLLQHQAMVDPSGLKDVETVDSVKIHVAAPKKWDVLPVKKATLYTDMQWRSPSRMTGVGVAYARLPLPMSAQTIAWLAEKEYAKRSQDGKLIARWNDELGRPWFEAENSRYHVRGYIVTKGFEAWIIYCGYKREQPPSAAELGIAARSLETIMPVPYEPNIPQRPMATGDNATPAAKQF